MIPTYLKVTFISGLQDIVLGELAQYPDLRVIGEGKDAFYLELIPNLTQVRKLRSVVNVYAIKQDRQLNPHFISKHKSIVGSLVETVLETPGETFRTFKISCAGSDSHEVRSIHSYIEMTYGLNESDDADMKIYIGKTEDAWEVGVEITARPLSLRDYKVENIPGAMNPTIAYAMNSLCDLTTAKSYLNIFSGSATLLIEAGQINPKLKLIGFDNDGKRTALAVQNIKKAGLIKTIQLKNTDLFDKPNLGMFDIIASDLPFGMQVSKEEDLEKLYQVFVDYCEGALNPNGTLLVYTTEHTTLERILGDSKFEIKKTLELKIVTSVNSYIYPKIFVCRLKSSP